MKKRRILTVVLLLCVVLVFFQRLQREEEERPTDITLFSLQHDGVKRQYSVHIPPGYDRSAPLPLVLALHGGGGSAINSSAYFGLNKKADEETFIVVYPGGTGKEVRGKTFGSWNAGFCCPPAMENNIDDVGFIREMLEDLKKRYSIDTKRIYATGMSNGALMSYRLACEMSDVFAAIAPSGAASGPDGCSQERPVPIIHFHGSEDHCASYTGGTCGGCLATYFNSLTGIDMVDDFTWQCDPIPAYLKEWSVLNNCIGEIRETFRNGDASCITYTQCTNNADVTLCTIEGMGHVWAGKKRHGVQPCIDRPNGYLCNTWKDVVGNTSTDLTTNDLLWDFFRRHSLL